ncbi:hypothetical protein BAUCODRAFT_151940 [Baudoinia panamericana UAMH 10762]|uniref:Uncharacterized protein n=1 Tax=Baudoinia panamericana (strain UAMH 10762) TaxID=717646 RepID=M2M4L4_BAUPA|nr:uncharacterized protein BAUCODRAFT_151940 [Baudoinia panamericana UAMH 10762]EMC91531.1 hypothetical protein BAUCODRAFT_151940 [Baudoinia panamericana UAMH 10762]
MSDDELLAILRVNLRNAASTFGKGTPPYESIRTVIEEHLKHSTFRGAISNELCASRHPAAPRTQADRQVAQPSNTTYTLAYRSKPAS